MFELPLVFLAGILGSSHCVGMCGPFAVTIGSGAGSWQANLRRQILYTVGRVFTYAVMGACAGYAGRELASQASFFRHAAAGLAIIAGLVLVYQGLLAAGIIRRRLSTSTLPCAGSTLLATFLRSPSKTSIFLAGLLTGMLPCGLVYGFVALAASTGDFAAGMLLMVAFGLGTAPVMMLTGGGAALISLGLRRRLYQAAAWCVVLTGMLSIARGAACVNLPGRDDAVACPGCVMALEQGPMHVTSDVAP